MKKLDFHKFLFIGIILIAAIVRFWGLSSNPPALNWDEAALGYNAYSLSIDGKDEYGRFLPITALESYGDYKPVLYSYLTIFPVKLFGLNEFSIRFVSALFGTLSVVLTYFLVKEIFYSKKKVLKFDVKTLALLSSFIFAISPWHIMLSRAAFEANVASFLIIAGILFFLAGINRKGYYFIFSAVFFALSFYTFNSARVFTPLFVITISILSYKELIKKWKFVVVAGVLGALMIFPLVNFLNSPQAKLRFNEVNIFSNLEIIEESNRKIAENNNSAIAKIIYNRRVGYAKEFASHYLDHFNPKFLFITGDGNPRFSVQKVGQMYIWDILFLIIGIAVLLKIRPGKWYILPIWILVGIIPAAMARETPHALRIESILPAPQIIIAFGFLSFYVFLKSKTKYASSLGVIVLALLVFNFLYFLKILYTDYKRDYAGEWQYGYGEIAKYANSEVDNYEKVYVDEEIGRPYIYNLIYNDIPPEDFRKNSTIERDVFGLVNVASYKNIYYKRGLSDIYNAEPENLYIKYFNDQNKIPQEVPEGAEIKKILKLPNGKIIFVAYTGKK